MKTKNIILKKLHLINFKGAKDLKIDFGVRTSISGDNATGKTTVFDAFNFLLFGKDSQDRKDFNIKTLDSENNAISKLDHSVEAILLVDDKEIVLQRVFKEKWVKKRGETTSEFSGHETTFFVNGVPVQASAFQNEVSAIIPEQIFKLVTSPYYFASLKWQDARVAILSMAGDITDQDVAAGNDRFMNLLAMESDLVKLKRETTAKRKMLNEELIAIPTRVDEATRTLAEREDVISLKVSLTEKQSRISEIDSAIESEQQSFNELNRANINRQQEIHRFKTQLTELEFVEKKKLDANQNKRLQDVQNCEGRIQRLETAISSLKDDILVQKSKIERNHIAKAELVKKWETKNAEQLVFADNEFTCPTCERELSNEKFEEKRKELTEKFNAKKTREIAAITEEGTQIKRAIDSAQNNLTASEKTLADKETELATETSELAELLKQEAPKGGVSLDFVLAKNQTYQDVKEQIKEIESLIQAAAEPDLSALKLEKQTLNTESDGLKSAITTQELREKTVLRIEQLEKRESELSQQIADVEKTEFTIAEFEKAKIEMLESRVSSLFKTVRFKMYNRLINGGEEPTCEALINGVPFSDANHAAQINAGIDIVNAFSKHHGVTAPVFIDNAEAVTRLLETDSQLIRLVVSPSDKKLRVDIQQPIQQVVAA